MIAVHSEPQIEIHLNRYLQQGNQYVKLVDKLRGSRKQQTKVQVSLRPLGHLQAIEALKRPKRWALKVTGQHAAVVR